MTSAPTILLVDDDETTRHIMRWLLNELCVPGSVQVLEASHGAQALRLVRVHGEAAACPPPLLVLLDLNMPVMDGLEFMECLRSLPASCRQATTVVAVSATVDPAEYEAAIKLADTFTSKPLKMEELAAMLRHYLPGVLAVGQS